MTLSAAPRDVHYVWASANRGGPTHLLGEDLRHSANPKALCRRRVRTPVGRIRELCPECVDHADEVSCDPFPAL